MRKLFLAILFATIIGCNYNPIGHSASEHSNVGKSITSDTVRSWVSGFNQHGNLITFDIWIQRTTTNPFRMGASDWVLNHIPHSLSLVSLSDINPRYSSHLGYYPLYSSENDSNLFIGVAYVPQGGLSEIISAIPEKLCTVTMQIIANPWSLNWNTNDSHILNPIREEAIGRYDFFGKTKNNVLGY